jgi:hypothetical protein
VTARPLALALIVIGCLACAAPTATASTPPATCVPSDQDRYVYRPARLQVIAPCTRVFGTVEASSLESDGDVHINVRLDPPYLGLLNDGNRFEDGDLVVEPVCQIPPPQADAIRICAADPDPLAGPLPHVGDHVWMEGRQVLDLQHHGWVELHPLYRWGIAP